MKHIKFIGDPKKMTPHQRAAMLAEAEAATWENSRPLTRTERHEIDQMSRQGRKKIGAGAQRINITVERDLLKRADAYARNHGMTRAGLVGQALKKILAA